MAWLKTTPYFSLRREVPERYLRALHDAVEKRGTHVALWPTPETVAEAYRIGLPVEAALVYTPQESAEFLAAGHSVSLLLRYADTGLSPMEAVDVAAQGLSPDYVEAALAFGATRSEDFAWLKSEGITAHLMTKLARTSATLYASARYTGVAADAGMTWRQFCEYAAVVPLVIVIPAYQTGRTPAEVKEWRESQRYDARWVQDVNIEGHRWHPRSIQSPGVAIGRFIREMYEWVHPGLPDEYLNVLIQHPDGVVAL